VPLSVPELEPLLRLSLVQGVGPQRLCRLMSHFGEAERVLGASERALRGIAGIGSELAARLRAASGAAAKEATRRALRDLDRVGAVALTPADPLYPSTFRVLHDPPFLLFAAGDLALLDRTSIAVVGTRSPTVYGRSAAELLSRDLALAGLAIVSGVARGIDTAAHRGALAAEGATVGVLGHAIEQVYPPENRSLFRTIREKGLLLTEYPPGEGPRAGNFPRRNRLISALCEAVLVVEMGHRSGAQHTVSFALELGREVMAVPGPIASTMSEGTNQLIRDGARLITSATDVIEELRGVGAALPPTAPPPAGGSSPPSDTLFGGIDSVDASEIRLLESLGPVPLQFDEVVASAGLTTGSALTMLLELELRGLVRAFPGMRFARL